MPGSSDASARVFAASAGSTTSSCLVGTRVEHLKASSAIKVGEIVGSVEGVFARPTNLGDELPREDHYKKKKAMGHPIFGRIRLGQKGQPAVPVLHLGLDGSMEWQRSFRSKAELPPSQANERAVLVQTAENLEGMLRYGHSVQPPLVKPMPKKLEPGAVGENLHWNGGSKLSSRTVCVGDEFEVLRQATKKTHEHEHEPDTDKNGKSVVDKEEWVVVSRFQVASPRLPCANIDSKFGQSFAKHGMRAEAARTGFCGFFCRVLQTGSVREGDAVRLCRRPHPSWPLRRICQLLYSSDSAVMRLVGGSLLP